MDFPIVKVIKNNIKVELDYIHPQEQEVVRALLNVVIVEGKTYPQRQPLSQAEFSTYWLSKDAFVVRTSVLDATHKPKEILGRFI